MKTRISIAGLMVLVAAVALVSAIAAFAADLRADAVVILTAGVLSIASLGVRSGRGVLAPFCLGFMACGWSYFVASSFSPHVRLALPTTPPLMRLYESLIGSPTTLKPEDFLPFLFQLHDYLRVAHSLLALAIAVAGGMFTASVMALLRRSRASAT
jgi:hypothetical protein